MASRARRERNGGGSRRGNSVRIIGGTWRGRRLSFPDRGGIRPSPDRVRETLFNWLQPVVHGARCLDAFAGSGVLGLEALSRGAAEAVLIEKDPRLADAIRASAETLGATTAHVHQGDALVHLRQAEPAHYDIIFLDPPYASGLAARSLELIAAGGILAEAGRIYLECDAGTDPQELAPGFELLRSGEAGQVGYHLLARRDGGADRGTE